MSFQSAAIGGQKVIGNITGLLSDTHYNIYLTCGNKHPGIPQLLNDDDIVLINWKTDARPANTLLKTSSGLYLAISLLIYLI